MYTDFPISKISASQLIPQNIYIHNQLETITQVEIDPIDFCNHKCSWCFTANFRESNKINLIDLKKYLDLFCYQNGKSVVFSGGGEPLLYKEIYTKSKVFEDKSIASYLINKNIHIGFITNGLLLNKIIEDDLNIKKISFIRISLDSTNENDHSQLHKTKKSDFNKIIENITNLIKLRGKSFTPAIGISYVVDPLSEINFNSDTVKNISNLAKTLNIDFVQFKHIHTKNEEFAKDNMKILHDRCNKLDWGSVEYWVQNYNSSQNQGICKITKIIQSIGNNSKRFPCCHNFGKIHFLDQNLFEPKGKEIENCKSNVCRYTEMNQLLVDNNKKQNEITLSESIKKYGFHPYRYCPTAPEIFKPFKTIK